MGKMKITLYEYDDYKGKGDDGGNDIEKCIQELKDKEKTTWIKIDNIKEEKKKEEKREEEKGKKKKDKMTEDEKREEEEREKQKRLEEEKQEERRKAFISKLVNDFVKISDTKDSKSKDEVEEFEPDKYVGIEIKKDFIFLSLDNTNYDFEQRHKDEKEENEGAEQKGLDYVTREKVYVIFNKKNLISISEKDVEPFNRVTKRIKEEGIGKKKLRKPCYLAYALLKAIIDNHFRTIDEIGHDVYRLNRLMSVKSIKSNMEFAFTGDILGIRQDIITLRSAVFQIKSIFSELLDTESEIIDEETREYIRRLQSHLFTLLDLVAMARDHVSTSMEVLLTKTSNETNSVMKVLTTMAIIFLPLTFVTGIFGMTFVDENVFEAFAGKEFVSAQITSFVIIIIAMTIIALILGYTFHKRNYLKI